jgi:hypothetical protein
MSQTIHTPAPQESPPRPFPNDGNPPQPINQQISSIFGSLWRIAKLELNICITSAKLAVVRIVLFTVLAIVASLIALAGVIILDVCLYHVLTDLLKLPTVYALLIFAGVHLLFAAIVFAIAFKTLHNRRPKSLEKNSK